MISLLGIKTAGTDIAVGSLSGGNQQKVVIAKWLMNQPRIILLNDPTRGIDVGTKQELYVFFASSPIKVPPSSFIPPITTN